MTSLSNISPSNTIFNNKYSSNNSAEIGELAEIRFRKLAYLQGWTTKDTNKNKNIKDITEHWDISITKQDKTFKVDIKGLKRPKGRWSEQDDQQAYIELKNVRGSPGWLYGKADKIAFETKTGFIIVDRLELESLVNKLVNINSIPKESVYNKKPYVLYTRSQWGRKDVITLINTKDLAILTPIIWIE